MLGGKLMHRKLKFSKKISILSQKKFGMTQKIIILALCQDHDPNMLLFNSRCFCPFKHHIIVIFSVTCDVDKH